MIDLTGTSALDVKHGDYHKAVWLVVVRADEPTGGEVPQYFGTRTFVLNSKTYEDLLAGISIESTDLLLKGGLAHIANFEVRLRNEGKLSQLQDNYFLENDDLEVYELFVDEIGGNDDADRIPIARGVIDQYPSDLNEWTLTVVDGSDRDMIHFPSRLVDLSSHPYAPLDALGKPLPVPFGIMEQGPYDDAGTSRFLARCRCVDIYLAKYTAGVHNKASSTPFQWFSQAKRLAEIVDYTISGQFFSVDTPKRKLLLRPVRTGGTNTISGWSGVADGKTATTIAALASDFLDIYFGGMQKVGSLNADPTVEIKATGAYDYTVKLGGTMIISGSDTNDASIPVAQTNWAEDWDFELLQLILDFTSSTTVGEIYLDVRFDDQSGIDAQAALEIFQKVQGFEDQTSKYADGGLITGVAGTVLENPVDQVQAFLRAKDLLNRPIAEIDTASFTTARAKRTSWTFAFELLETIKDITWLDPLLQEAGLHLYKSVAGQWRIIARDKSVEPQHTLLDRWNIAVENPEDEYADYLPDFDLDRIKTRDLTNEFVVHAQLDRCSNEYNVLQIASSAYRITGPCSVNGTTGRLNAPGQLFVSDDVVKGWNVYVDTDQGYEITLVVGEEDLDVTPLEGGQVQDSPAGTTFWLGPSLDPDVLRSRRRYKALNPLGRASEGFRDIGGYESRFVADAATAQLMIDHWKEFHGQLPLASKASTFIGHLDIEPGDVVWLDQPWLPEKKRPTDLTVLDGAITNSATTMKVTDDEVELLRVEDFVLLRGNPRQPEIVKVTGIDGATDIATIERGTCGTKAYAHGDGTKVERVTVKWEVLGVQPAAPTDARIRLRLVEMPNSYFPVLTIAPDGTPDWSGMTDLEKARYRAITYNSGLIEERDPDSLAVIGAD